MILGIDPSYTRSGVALMNDEGEIIHKENISADEPVYSDITKLHFGAFRIADRIVGILEDYHLYDVDVIVEYPAFATQSGSYLGVLNGVISQRLRVSNRVKSVTWIPPTACDSFTQNKKHSKTYLVNYCKEKGWIDVKERVSHDICTAIIFCKLFQAIQQGIYKNKSFKVYSSL